MVKEDFSVVPSNHATSDGRYSTLFRNTHSSAVEHWTKTITCLTIGMHQADGAWGSMQEALEVPMRHMPSLVCVDSLHPNKDLLVIQTFLSFFLVSVFFILL